MKLALLATVLVGLADPTFGQSGNQMTHEQLVKLTSNGLILNLGGADEGYAGKLTLRSDGTGKGGATTDAGDQITISGKWWIQDGRFCRVWAALDKGKEVCETWYLTSGSSVEVYNGKSRIGVNSW